SLSLAIRVQPNRLTAAVLELFGDELHREYPMQKTGDGWRVELTAPEEEAALWYRFRCETGDQVFWLGPAPDGIHAWLRNSAQDGFRLTVYRRDFDTPAWFQNGVMYQVFPDRFAFSDDGTAEAGIRYHEKLGQVPELHSSKMEEVRWQPRSFEEFYIPDDFYGGTLRGIREKIPYLKELGISVLYLNPIFEARSNHRYDTSNYLKIDPILGSTEDFAELCRAAAEAGIRVLCDGVFSHTGADSIYFNRDGHYPDIGACQNKTSPYFSWYDFRQYPDQYRSWWGFAELPEVNENDPSWQDYVVTGKDSVIRQWLRCGASGWRLDVADELPDNVLCLIREAAKEEKNDSVILGEVWEDAVLKESYGSRRKYALGGALDSVMNYPFRTAALDFLHGRIDAFALSDFLTGQQLHYPQPIYVCLMNLLGSHDTERLYTALATDLPLKDYPREMQRVLEQNISDRDYRRAEKLEKMALTLQFSVPGMPSIYYGDELGMTGVNDPFNRRPMENTEGAALHGFLQYLRELSAFRREHRAFREGDAFFLANDPDVLLILRTLPEEAILTVINRAGTKRRFRLEAQGRTTEGLIEACSAKITVL
ncbi:MAG: glycoside hydrolase family 13 protein, partial [Candidatus Limivicinus sp.]